MANRASMGEAVTMAGPLVVSSDWERGVRERLCESDEAALTEIYDQ